MREFNFKGDLGASKSLFNRALIISSFNEKIKIIGKSKSDDIALMQAAIKGLGASKEFDCGSAGTVLRFLALRLAREKGVFKLKARPRLFQRLLPQLQQTLSQLGTESRLLDDCNLELDCDSWRPRGDGLWIPSGESSQFASAILLSAWNLDSPLHFVRSGQIVSDSYFQMTLDLVRSFGMLVDVHEQEVSIAAKQIPLAATYSVECDVSSAFAVAALAALTGTCQIENFPERPLQPDAIFISHLIRMGIPVQQGPEGLRVEKAQKLQGVSADLRNTPDLFPVLASLACFASGESQFQGVSHLAFKESNRLVKTKELVEKIGGTWSSAGDSEVSIRPTKRAKNDQIEDFDVDDDHRLVMAVAVAQAGGAQINALGAQAVSKSFRGFEEIWPL